MDHQFRNAALGGFNKQDVLDYLELLVRDHNAQLQSMQEQLDQSQEQCLQMEQQISQHAGQTAQLQQENEQLAQEVAQLKLQLACSNQKLSALRTKALQDAQARQDLQTQVDKLLPDANAYIAVKERTAGVELDAHRRAQLVVDQAQDEAQQLHTKMEQWLGRVNRQYSDLRGQMDATVSHAAGELAKVNGLLEQITQVLVKQDAELEQLQSVYAKCEVAKVPAPMPIPEE